MFLPLFSLPSQEKVRRPFLSILLALILLSPVATTWLGTAWQRHMIREGVEARLRQGADAAELTVLAFTKSGAKQLLRWEHEREFEYQGEMYDVVRTQSMGDSLFYTCIHDHAESALNRQIDQWLAQWLRHSPAQQEQAERLMCFFRSLFCVPATALATMRSVNARSVFHYQYPAGEAAAPVPPPPPQWVWPISIS